MAEKEYIERGALFEAVRDKSMTQFDWSEKVDLEEFEEVLNYIPAADVVAVVRCKDCKWWHKGGCAFRKDCTADLPSADDFCSHGERKEQERQIKRL